MSFAARLDQPHLPLRPLWGALVVLGFIFWWPVGVATLAFLIGSGRMGCGHHHEGWEHGRWQERMMARRARWEEKWGRRHARPSSGNRAFDSYRDETLRRLEEEEKEFREFLDRLRFAKDKAEFDEFLTNRRPAAATSPEGPAPN